MKTKLKRPKLDDEYIEVSRPVATKNKATLPQKKCDVCNETYPNGFDSDICFECNSYAEQQSMVDGILFTSEYYKLREHGEESAALDLFEDACRKGTPVYLKGLEDLQLTKEDLANCATICYTSDGKRIVGLDSTGQPTHDHNKIVSYAIYIGDLNG